MGKTIRYLAGCFLGVLLMGMNVSAAEYTVTDASAVLYTNGETVILAEADSNTVVLPEVAADLPILVTGVTSNGYFRIDLGGQTFYIPGIGLAAAPSASNIQAAELTAASAASAPENDLNAASVTNQIHDVLMAQKAIYPEGMSWTNANFVRWKGGIYSGGYGCAGFAFALSDAAFGNAPALLHRDYSNIKVGDILRVDNDTHSVIVLEVRQNSVIVAEGNYNNSVHWGREIAISNLQGSGNYIMTRY